MSKRGKEIDMGKTRSKTTYIVLFNNEGGANKALMELGLKNLRYSGTNVTLLKTNGSYYKVKFFNKAPFKELLYRCKNEPAFKELLFH